MADYCIRPATLDDADALVHHRVAMFQDMGVPLDPARLGATYRRWLIEMMPKGVYRAWVVETPQSEIVAGGGITIIQWPPGPQFDGDRLAFVYNVYTEPAHRRRGLGRRVMEAIHDWCREARIQSIALNASRFGQSLYESMGYSVTPSPMMFLALE
jgi:GNAT superfamily N-acetyltransferase